MRRIPELVRTKRFADLQPGDLLLGRNGLERVERLTPKRVYVVPMKVVSEVNFGGLGAVSVNGGYNVGRYVENRPDFPVLVLPNEAAFDAVCDAYRCCEAGIKEAQGRLDWMLQTREDTVVAKLQELVGKVEEPVS